MRISASESGCGNDVVSAGAVVGNGVGVSTNGIQASVLQTENLGL
jgi:hypothetical protein